ncbi:uncharacterized protein LOC120356926 [Solenopsis invicta]|uniref:uncharacterized protein LOC120356926 n=1 Tax=Solenopsis invicta TaxID=13686 RepID=UPI00193CBB9B|nr:uncharacterized protein LOC120356926 [Solenopsis invicta]
MVGSNDDIPAVEKFHHLKSSLTGDAARHIANVPAFILVHFIIRRLDPETREAWKLRQGIATDPATFRELDDFLDGRICALEVIAPGNSSKTVKAAKTLATKPASRVNATNSFCDGSHFIDSCNEFAAKPTEDRREFVVSKRLCANCLGNHRLTECKSAKRCRLCGGHHHTLIHRASATSSVAMQPGQGAASKASSSAVALAVATGSGAISLYVSGCRLDAPAMTLLSTVRVRVLNRSGQAIEARALLDFGAELSLVRELFAQLLRCPRHHPSIPLLGVGSLPSYTTRGALTLRLQSCVDPTFEFDAAAYVVPRVMSRAPGEEVNPTAWSQLCNLPLADPTWYKPGPVDLILGSDVLSHLFGETFRRGTLRQPVAQYSKLGWVIYGPSGVVPNLSTPTALPSHGISNCPDHELETLLRQFWMQEEVALASQSAFTEDEAQCEAHFRDTYPVALSIRPIHCPPTV